MPDKIDVNYVYAGAILHDDAIVHSYIQVEDGELGAAVVYAKQLSKHSVGSVLKFVAMGSPDNLVVATATFVEMWADEKQTAMWVSMSQAIIDSEKAYTEALGNPNPMMKALDPLRAAYGKLGKRERAILLAQISAYIASED